jgi:hypothetical protein
LKTKIWRDYKWQISVSVNMVVNNNEVVVKTLNYAVWHAVKLSAAGIDLESNPSVLVVSGTMV